MTKELWDDFPRLAKGTFDRDAGMGCVMNLISYQNGDAQITDMPSCTHPAIAVWMQRLNDTICTHTNNRLLCVDCTTTVLGYEPLIVGTEPPADEREATRLNFAMFLSIVDLVRPHAYHPQEFEAAVEALDVWMAGGSVDVLLRALWPRGDFSSSSSSSSSLSSLLSSSSSSLSSFSSLLSSSSLSLSLLSSLLSSSSIVDRYIDTYYNFTGKTKPTVENEHVANLRELARCSFPKAICVA